MPLDWSLNAQAPNEILSLTFANSLYTSCYSEGPRWAGVWTKCQAASPKPAGKCSQEVSKMPNDLFACGRPGVTFRVELGLAGSGSAACSVTLLFDLVHIWLGRQPRQQARLSCVLWHSHSIFVMKVGKGLLNSFCCFRVVVGEGRSSG